jgi:hypothetical protein
VSSATPRRTSRCRRRDRGVAVTGLADDARGGAPPAARDGASGGGHRGLGNRSRLGGGRPHTAGVDSFTDPHRVSGRPAARELAGARRDTAPAHRAAARPLLARRDRTGFPHPRDHQSAGRHGERAGVLRARVDDRRRSGRWTRRELRGPGRPHRRAGDPRPARGVPGGWGHRHERLSIRRATARRWRLDARRLPAGSVVLYDEPSVWRQYGGYIAGAWP